MVLCLVAPTLWLHKRHVMDAVSCLAHAAEVMIQ